MDHTFIRISEISIERKKFSNHRDAIRLKWMDSYEDKPYDFKKFSDPKRF